MKKENENKTESHYHFNLGDDSDDYETLKIIQEENVPERNAIKFEFYQERWRTPVETMVLLQRAINTIKQNFLNL